MKIGNEIPKLPLLQNKDDIKAAIDGLNQFTKNWCMNVQITEATNKPTFRCSKCEFFDKTEGQHRCILKAFAYAKDYDYTGSIDFGAYWKY